MGKGDINPFAPLQDENDEEEEEEKEDTAMKEATEESGGGETTTNTAHQFFRRYKPKSVSTEDSRGGKTESSSTTPKVSASTKSTGTPVTVSFAATTDRNETSLNRMQPTAKEKQEILTPQSAR